MNSEFAKMFCINLDYRRDRWERMTHRFSRLGVDVERISGVDALELSDVPEGWTAEGFGCLLSHRKILQTAVDQRLDPFFVFEDDAEFVQDCSEKWLRWFSQVPDDWEVLYLGAACLEPMQRVSPNVSRVIRGLGSHAFGIRLRAAELLLEYVNTDAEQIDQCLTKIQSRGASYCFTPFLSWQETGFSDIQQKIVSWNQWMQPTIV